MNVIVFKPIELLKSKYVKRWKGKDGKWHYSYKQTAGTKAAGKAEALYKELQGELEDVFDSPNDPETLQWVRRMAKEEGPGTTRRALRITLGRFSWAQREGYTFDSIDRIMASALRGEKKTDWKRKFGKKD